MHLPPPPSTSRKGDCLVRGTAVAASGIARSVVAKSQGRVQLGGGVLNKSIHDEEMDGQSVLPLEMWQD